MHLDTTVASQLQPKADAILAALASPTGTPDAEYLRARVLRASTGRPDRRDRLDPTRTGAGLRLINDPRGRRFTRERRYPYG
jgi:hypothetical protein